MAYNYFKNLYELEMYLDRSKVIYTEMTPCTLLHSGNDPC